MKNFFAILTGMLMLAACGDGSKEDTEKVSVPDAPSTVALHGTPTQTSLTFQWTAVNGATGYEYKLTQGTTQVQSETVRNRNVTINDLTAGTTYQFAVRALNDAGKSDWSKTVEATTASEVDPGPGPGPDPGPDPQPTIAYEDFAIPAAEEDGQARAFPGAEGGGMYATGGRGGTVYHVTSLADTNTEGTLRYAVNQSGPRIVVFDVAGIIELQSQLNITKGDLTIAGQTAPGDGICLKGYTFRISASNVIVRFIRCRMGDETNTEDDAIQVMSHDEKYEKIVIDHCSVSWSTDECASFYGMKDFTFQWNIVSESLRVSIHGKGSHGYGGIWGGSNATYHHNLLAHHDSRNPRIDHDYVSTQKGPVTIANNVVYNWSGNTCYGGESSANNGSDYKKYNFVGNYYKPGPATPSSHIWFLEPTTSCSNCGGTILPGHFYMTGNYMDGKSAYADNNWSTSAVHANQSTIDKIKESAPYACNPMSLQSAQDAFYAVTTHAGASLSRDDIDTRIAWETVEGKYTYTGSKGGTKGLIDTQQDVGGWPAYDATSDEKDAVRDSDGDGIPNAIEEAWGLEKSNNADGKAYTLDPQKRYTNLEMYLHYLVKGIVAGGNDGATYGNL